MGLIMNKSKGKRKQSVLFKAKIIPGKPGAGKLFDEEFEKDEHQVECLGMTFPNNAERSAHFLGILREKLKDPEFRKIEGFPIGTDEDILVLSDPPYFTACPNPFIADFIKHNGKPYDPSKPYSREPFAADVSEGKNDPIYNAHSYHTKVPHKAIMRYILHYTEPGDIVFDGFCGTGMTGVAAQLCGDKTVVESLGYRVDKEGKISQQEIDENEKVVWKPFSKLGARRAVLNDLSPIATFIAYNYNTPVDVREFEREARRILKEVEVEYGWMYETQHADGKTMGKINYTVWSDVFVCPECTGEVVFWDVAVDMNVSEVKLEFDCPHCLAKLTKRNVDRIKIAKYDAVSQKVVEQIKQVPVLINYSVGKKRYEKKPKAADLAIIDKIESLQLHCWYPTEKMMFKGDKWGDTWRAGVHSCTNQVNHFYTKRNILILSSILMKIDSSLSDNRVRKYLKIWFTSSQSRLHRMNRYAPQHSRHVGPMANTFYLSSTPAEISPFYFLELKLKENAVESRRLYTSFVTTGSATQLQLNENLFDYLFIDPPFGANIMYSELNFLWESWLKVWTNNKSEAIESKSQVKTIGDYRSLMLDGFKEAYRVLKPGRWMTVEFSNTNASVWNSIQTALADAGFIVANVSALDKLRGGLQAIIGTTAVKQDLIISAYKPNGGFENRFQNEASTEEGVWDFVRTHLKYLPIVKRGTSTHLIAITERDPRILYDQMVAYYVRKGFAVPLNSGEFQEGLSKRFSYRDGMYFLPDQVAEYDKNKLTAGGMEQMPLFVFDESSAIAWLRQLLKDKPQLFQDIHPLFIRELGGWQKHEKPLELSELLAQNFLRYDGNGEVPNQIHSYLSTNFKELRNLPKNDNRLREKGKDRWYVSDPNKASDLEKLRERSLLREFWEYLPAGYKPSKPIPNEQFIPGLEPKGTPIPRGKMMKVIRLEAVRAGFKLCWQNRDYRTILAVAQRIPENVLQEDPKLLMWYDQALTRSGEE